MLGHTFHLAGMPGGWEVWIILIIVLLLFGRRIPQVARSLGQGISQFKKGLGEADMDPTKPAEPDEGKKADEAKKPEIAEKAPANDDA